MTKELASDLIAILETVGWEGVPRKEQEDENQEERRTTPGL